MISSIEKIDGYAFKYVIDGKEHIYDLQKPVKAISKFTNSIYLSLNKPPLHGDAITISDFGSILKESQTNNVKDYRFTSYLTEDEYVKIDNIQDILRDIIMFIISNFEGRCVIDTIVSIFIFWGNVEFKAMMELYDKLYNLHKFTDSQMSELLIGIVTNICGEGRDEKIDQFLNKLYDLDCHVYFPVEDENISYLAGRILSILVREKHEEKVQAQDK